MSRNPQSSSILIVAFILSCSSAFACPRFQAPAVNFEGISTKEELDAYARAVGRKASTSIGQLGTCHRHEQDATQEPEMQALLQRQQLEINQWFSDVREFDAALVEAVNERLRALESNQQRQSQNAAPGMGSAPASQVGAPSKQSGSAVPPSQRASDNRCNSLAIADSCERAVGRLGDKFGTCVHETEIELGCWRADSGTTKGIQ